VYTFSSGQDRVSAVDVESSLDCLSLESNVLDVLPIKGPDQLGSPFRPVHTQSKIFLECLSVGVGATVLQRNNANRHLEYLWEVSGGCDTLLAPYYSG
jgi:hypothetical protein